MISVLGALKGSRNMRSKQSHFLKGSNVNVGDHEPTPHICFLSTVERSAHEKCIISAAVFNQINAEPYKGEIVSERWVNFIFENLL